VRGNVTRGDRRGAYMVLVGKPEGRRPLRRPRRRWEDNSKLILNRWDEGMDWIDFAQGKARWRTLVNAATNIRPPYNVGNFLTS
jgi:hypothetical protein